MSHIRRNDRSSNRALMSSSSQRSWKTLVVTLVVSVTIAGITVFGMTRSEKNLLQWRVNQGIIFTMDISCQKGPGLNAFSVTRNQAICDLDVSGPPDRPKVARVYDRTDCTLYRVTVHPNGRRESEAVRDYPECLSALGR